VEAGPATGASEYLRRPQAVAVARCASERRKVAQAPTWPRVSRPCGRGDCRPRRTHRSERRDRALPKGQREVVVLHYLADLRVSAIAEQLGVSVGNRQIPTARRAESRCEAISMNNPNDPSEPDARPCPRDCRFARAGRRHRRRLARRLAALERAPRVRTLVAYNSRRSSSSSSRSSAPRIRARCQARSHPSRNTHPSEFEQPALTECKLAVGCRARNCPH